MAWFFQKSVEMPSPDEALPGREMRMPVPAMHFVNGAPLEPPFPDGTERALFGMGCFWGAERVFWQAPGVLTTAVGYAAGYTPNPTYEEVCSGLTGHNEVVLAVFDPAVTSYDEMLRLFWENHDPTQGMRQGADVGTQYRSGVYCYSPAQFEAAERSREAFQEVLTPTATARSRRRSSTPRSSTTPRTTTSSTSRRCRTATAASAAPGWPAPSASPRWGSAPRPRAPW